MVKKLKPIKELALQEYVTFHRLVCEHSEFRATISRSDLFQDADSYTPVEIIVKCPICNSVATLLSNGETQIEILRVKPNGDANND